MTASTEAVERLRQALISGGDVSGALRNLFFRNLGFWSALGSAALAVRYGAGSGRDLSALIGGVAAASAASGTDFPARQAELFVRAVLDPATADLNFDPVGFDVPDTVDAVLVALFREWQPTADEVAALFTRTEASLAQSGQFMPSAEHMREVLAALEAGPDVPVDPKLRALVLAPDGPFADFNGPLPEAFRKVIRRASQQIDVRQLPPDQAAQLARLLVSQDDFEGARVAYEQVVASGEGELVAWANLWLGKLLARTGDTSAACAALQAASQSRHPDYGPDAAYFLGALLSELRDISGARQAWQLAEDSAHPVYAALAA